jgi:hypothetical protein
MAPRPCRQCHGRRADLDNDNRLRCRHCDATRGRVSGSVVAFIEAVVKAFGPLDRPVQLRHQKEAAPGEQRPEKKRAPWLSGAASRKGTRDDN